MPTNDSLVTTSAAAELLGEQRRAVLRLVDAGHLKPAKKLPGLRGAYLFDREVVEALAKSREAAR